MAEAGMPGFDASIWIGLLAPAGTQTDIVERIAHGVSDVLHRDEVLASMHLQGLDASGGRPQEFAAFIAAESRKWLAVAHAASLRN
jgi:tripartite-type tricarboxylate transporter receptor subunit TctC